MAQKIKKGGSINKRYKVIYLENRYFIVDTVNPYKLINYAGFFAMTMRKSYPAWEIAKEDLTSLQYQNTDTYLPSPTFFEGAHDYYYEEGVLDERVDVTPSENATNLAGTIGFALVPTISAIPGLNLPGIARWIFLAIAVGFALFQVIKLLRIPRLKTDHYKPIVIAVAKSYGDEAIGGILFFKALVFLISVTIQLVSIYLWVTIPLGNFNIIYYLVATFFAWATTFVYFGHDLRGTENTGNEDEKEMIKYKIITEPRSSEEMSKQRYKPLSCLIVWLLLALLVNVFRVGFVPEQTWLWIAIVSSAISVLIASRKHDGYNEKTFFSEN